ncbi:hypothetical protein C8J57DRAFT_1517987 [Mycena rebaudengoi]|nr:hypothetical protein C8J57DRAFT_1517987 [Mycena rebaudengoi]
MKNLGIASPFFLRPPFGSYNHLVRQVAFQQNKSLVLWDLDSRDSLTATVEESKGIYDAAINAIVYTLLALNHEIEETTELVGYAVDVLKTANYSLVTVWASRQHDDTWFCPYDDSD